MDATCDATHAIENTTMKLYRDVACDTIPAVSFLVSSVNFPTIPTASQAKKAIRLGRVTINGQALGARNPNLSPGDVIEVTAEEIVGSERAEVKSVEEALDQGTREHLER